MGRGLSLGPGELQGLERLEGWDPGTDLACVPGGVLGPGVLAPPTADCLPPSPHAPFRGGSSELGERFPPRSGRLLVLGRRAL